MAGTPAVPPASNRHLMESVMPSFPLVSDSATDGAELARRFAQHDEAAFVALLRRYNRTLFRVARAILKNAADAEDLLQESHLLADRHIADFRREAKRSTWLTRTDVN